MPNPSGPPTIAAAVALREGALLTEETDALSEKRIA
jgi:hypothetical protein